MYKNKRRFCWIGIIFLQKLISLDTIISTIV